MGDQPTNGPYHWGNGPKPTRKAGGRKIKTHGCFTSILVPVAGLIYAIKELVF